MSRNCYLGLLSLSFLICLIVICTTEFNNFPFTDLFGQSRLCAYTLNGIDPYRYIGSSVDPTNALGLIPPGWGTSPWGLLLGNVFYPGFNSFIHVKIYFFIANIVLVIATALVLSKSVEQLSALFSTIVFLLTILSPYFWWSVIEGNAGGMVCCLCIIGFILGNKYPRLSGLLLSVALVKPQIAIPFCIALLFRGTWKPLVLCAFINIISVIVVSKLVDTGAVKLVLEFFASNIGENKNYAGIFTLFTTITGNHKLSLLMSMTFGLIVLSIASWRLKERNVVGLFSVACVVSTFWCYSWSNDLFVLLIPTLIFIWSFIDEKSIEKKFLSIAAGMYCYFGFFIMDMIAIILNQLGIHYDMSLVRWIVRTIYEIGLLALCFFMPYMRSFVRSSAFFKI